MEPITAGAIATLAFEKTIEKFTESAWDKIDNLRKMVWDKIKSQFPDDAEKILQEADNGSKDDLEIVGDYLKIVMRKEPDFAEELKELYRHIESLGVVRQEMLIDVQANDKLEVGHMKQTNKQGDSIKQTMGKKLTAKSIKIGDMTQES